jgi:hypothetical protein
MSMDTSLAENAGDSSVRESAVTKAGDMNVRLAVERRDGAATDVILEGHNRCADFDSLHREGFHHFLQNTVPAQTRRRILYMGAILKRATPREKPSNSTCRCRAGGEEILVGGSRGHVFFVAKRY